MNIADQLLFVGLIGATILMLLLEGYDGRLLGVLAHQACGGMPGVPCTPG